MSPPPPLPETLLDRAGGCLAGLDAGKGGGAEDAFITAESIIDRGRVDGDDLCSRLAGEPGSNEGDTSLRGDGSLVRCIPVAIFHHAPTYLLVEDSRLCSRAAHVHADCQWSSAVINLVIAGLLSGADPLRALDGALALCSHRRDVAPAVLERARRAAFAEGSPEPPRTWASVLDTLEWSLRALLEQHSFAACLDIACEAGSGRPALLSVTGALAGAAFGLAALPERYRERPFADSDPETVARRIIAAAS